MLFRSEAPAYMGQTSQGYLVFDAPEGLVLMDPHCYRRPKTSLRSSPAMPQTALQWRVEPPRLGASP